MTFLDQVDTGIQSRNPKIDWLQKYQFGISDSWISSGFFTKYWFCLATVLSYTPPLRAGMSWKTPDSCVSQKIDIFRKKNHQKILSFKKVTAGGWWGGRNCKKRNRILTQLDSGLSYVSWFLIIPKHSKPFQRIHENAKNNTEIILNLLM